MAGKINRSIIEQGLNKTKKNVQQSLQTYLHTNPADESILSKSDVYWLNNLEISSEENEILHTILASIQTNKNLRRWGKNVFIWALESYRCEEYSGISDIIAICEMASELSEKNIDPLNLNYKSIRNLSYIYTSLELKDELYLFPIFKKLYINFPGQDDLFEFQAVYDLVMATPIHIANWLPLMLTWLLIDRIPYIVILNNVHRWRHKREVRRKLGIELKKDTLQINSLDNFDRRSAIFSMDSDAAMKAAQRKFYQNPQNRLVYSDRLTWDEFIFKLKQCGYSRKEHWHFKSVSHVPGLIDIKRGDIQIFTNETNKISDEIIKNWIPTKKLKDKLLPLIRTNKKFYYCYNWNIKPFTDGWFYIVIKEKTDLYLNHLGVLQKEAPKWILDHSKFFK